MYKQEHATEIRIELSFFVQKFGRYLFGQRKKYNMFMINNSKIHDRSL